ncbi:uncharacterized protein LOC103177415 [Callorhinchus milii]|uniref:uncharacterized protein LOC103177415 n=1 Tax=Callorhinchus milii TaxID=7868 RepID=UPI001C3F6C40|nr:uncharacterized protein LOC103177415 [Callorhinchus milii]
MNLKHKQIFHLWDLETLYEESLKLMIPKGPPLPPPLRSFGSQIEPVHMETTFIEEEARDRLEWHITQKKLQHHWGLPLFIQTSHEAFIPHAPKLILSQLNPRLDFVPLTIPMDLVFLTDEHRKLLEMITKKKIINRKWGLPTLIEFSLRNFMAVFPSKEDRALLFELEESKTTSSDTGRASNNQTVLQESLLQAKRGQMALQYKIGSESIKLNKTAEATIFAHLKPECQDKITMCLVKQSLEIKMNCLPEIVKQLYKGNYPPVSKKPLMKIIAPGEGFKKPRSSYICFIEQDAVDRIELNLKHRQISNLWGVSTLYEESMEIMIPKGPPVPPAIKSAVVRRDPVDTETTFFEEEARDILERHITQKKLQHNWGLPSHVQRSLEAFILPAPKLILSHLTVQPEFAIMVVPNELAFVSAEHKKILELNTKKRIINCKWGLPKLIQMSLSIFMAPAPVMYSNIDEGNKRTKMVPQPHQCKGTFPQNKKRKSIPQYEKECKSIKKIEKGLLFDGLKPEYKDNLHMCLIKQNLEIKLEYLPEMVQLLYRSTYPSASKKPLPKHIVSGEGFKKTRPSYLPFMEQDSIDRIEMNLKHRQIIHLWGLETEYEESMERMIPKGPSLPPVIKPSGAQIEPMAMEITFIDDESRNRLEWHVTQKKLQYNWGLPLDFQRSLEAFITPAPKLIPSQLNQQSHFVSVFSPPELNFISYEHQKRLEFNTRKRIINYKWGIPKAIQASLRNFIVPPPSINGFLPQRELVERNSTTSNLINFGGGNIDTPLCKRGNMWSKQTGRDSGIIKLNHTGVFRLPALRPEFRDKLNVSLIKHCLEIKMFFFPEMVNMLYKDTYPPASKKSLPKLVAPGDGFKKARSSYVPFIEQDSVDRLELNLKHRQITNLWGLETVHEKSMELMIPKGPPLPPTILASGTQVEHVGMETPFIADQTRDNLERHITLKKLQQNWGLPLHVQRSLEAFMSPAPKLIPSQLNPQPGFVIVVVPADLPFLRNEYRKTLEMNTKKKIINRKWGLPKLIQLSLKNFMPKAPQIAVLMLHSQMIVERPMMVVPYPGGVLIKRGKLSLSKYHRARSIKSKKNGEVNYFDGLKPRCKGKLEICLTKQQLEIKMEYLPELVKQMYRSTYPPVSKKRLPKFIASGEGFKKARSTYIPFIEQEAIDHLELNLKHKQILNLLGLPTLFEISTEMMISKGPPVPPAIIASRVQIESMGMETIFIENEKKEKLEWHITQKKLQLHWGLPLHLQRSLEAFIPPAPKLIPSQLKYKPNFVVVITHSELTFLSEEHMKKLELNTRKKIINQKWGLPNIIQSSLKNFMSPAPRNIDFILHSKNVEGNKAMSSNTDTVKNLKTFSQGTFLGLKGGKLPLLQYESDSKNIKLRKLAEISANFKPEYKAKLDICLTKQCLEIKMYHLPKLVMDRYKNTYPSGTNKYLPKLIAPGKGHKKSRPWYIPFIEQGDIDHIEMNLKHRQILYLWGLETLYEKSMKMLIPKGPPVNPPIKARGIQIEPVGAKAMFISDEVRNTLEWHILRKKLQLTWALPLYFQNSAQASVPSAPKLILSQLKSHPEFDIIVPAIEVSFISDDHKRVLEINIKKKNVNHRWGLPRLIQSSLNEFMVPPPPIKEFMMHCKITEENIRSNDLSKNFKINFPQETFILNKGQKRSLEDCFRESVKMNKIGVVSPITRFKPESNDNLGVCLIKQSLYIKMDCLPEMVIGLYKESYPPASKRPLLKVIAPGKGFKRPRLLYIPFAEQDIVDRLEMNLKHKQIYNLWGLATPYDKSIKMMIPKAPPLPPAIKGSGFKIEPTGRKTAFVPNAIRNILEWHITQKKLQHNWGLPLHLQRSADAFILPPPKLIPSQLNLCPNFDIVFSGNELVFLSEEHKETLELNTRNRIINHRWGLPKIIQTSLNSFIPPAPSVQDVMRLLKPEEVCVETFNKADLSKHYAAFPSEQAPLKMNTISSAECKLIRENCCLNNSEGVSVSVKLDAKDELDIEMKSILNKSSFPTPDKTLLKLDAPCRGLKKQNLQCKNSDNCLTVDCSVTSPNYRLKSMRTVDSAALTGQKLADLAYKPMTVVGLSLGPAVIGANLPSSHVTVQEELNIYLKQNIMNSVLSPRPVSYADCEEILAKNAREGGKTMQNGFCSERQCKNQLSEETKRHIQQDEEHGFCKIIAGGSVKNKKEQEKVHVDLSEIMQGQPSHAGVCETEQEGLVISPQEADDGNYLSVSDEELHGAYGENLNKSYHTSRLNVVKKKYKKTLHSRFPNQTKTDRILVKSKVKFSKQERPRPKTFKQEDRRKKKCNKRRLLVSPTEELQNVVQMTFSSENDQNERAHSYTSHCHRPESPGTTSVSSHSPRQNERSSQSSASQRICSLACQEALSSEDSQFTPNEAYYQCESPLFPQAVH